MALSSTRASLTATWAFWIVLSHTRFTHLNRITLVFPHPWIAKKRAVFSKRRICSYKQQLGWVKIASSKLTCFHQTKSSSTRKIYRRGLRKKKLISQGEVSITAKCNLSAKTHLATTTLRRLTIPTCPKATSSTTCQSPVPPGISQVLGCCHRVLCRAMRLISICLIAQLQRRLHLREGISLLDLEIMDSQIEEAWTLHKTWIVYRDQISITPTMVAPRDNSLLQPERVSSKTTSILIISRSSCKPPRDNILSMVAIRGQ